MSGVTVAKSQGVVLHEMLARLLRVTPKCMLSHHSRHFNRGAWKPNLILVISYNLTRFNQISQEPFIEKHIPTITAVLGFPSEHLLHKCQKLLFLQTMEALLAALKADVGDFHHILPFAYERDQRGGLGGSTEVNYRLKSSIVKTSRIVVRNP